MPAETSYVFKPMKALTPWMLGLIALKVFCILGWVSGQAVYLVEPALYDLVEVPVIIFAMLYAVTAIVSGILSLCWIYGAARNVKAIRPALDLTPGWAVGWFFVPFANLVKPCMVMADIAITSKGQVDGRYGKSPPLLLAWWLPNIFGNIMSSIATRFQSEEALVGSGPADIAFMIGMFLVAIGTTAFFKVVKDIYNDQKALRTELAEVF